MDMWFVTLLVSSAIVSTSFGVNQTPKRTFSNLLEDILDETGIRDRLPDLKEVIETDPDIQEFHAYLKNGKLEAFLNRLQGCSGFYEVKELLATEGLDFIKVQEAIHHFITSKSIRFQSSGHPDEDITFEYLLEKIDIEHITDVLQNKIDTDFVMQRLVRMLKGEDFQSLVTCVKTSEEGKEMSERLRNIGIDAELIGKFLQSRFDVPPTIEQQLDDINEVMPSIQKIMRTTLQTGEFDAREIIKTVPKPGLRNIKETFEDFLQMISEVMNEVLNDETASSELIDAIFDELMAEPIPLYQDGKGLGDLLTQMFLDPRPEGVPNALKLVLEESFKNFQNDSYIAILARGLKLATEYTHVRTIGDLVKELKLESYVKDLLFDLRRELLDLMKEFTSRRSAGEPIDVDSLLEIVKTFLEKIAKPVHKKIQEVVHSLKKSGAM